MCSIAQPPLTDLHLYHHRHQCSIYRLIQMHADISVWALGSTRTDIISIYSRQPVRAIHRYFRVHIECTHQLSTALSITSARPPHPMHATALASPHLGTRFWHTPHPGARASLSRRMQDRTRRSTTPVCNRAPKNWYVSVHTERTHINAQKRTRRTSIYRHASARISKSRKRTVAQLAHITSYNSY